MPRCCPKSSFPGPHHTDAARRLSDTVAMHLVATNGGARGMWVAAKLSDGSGDNVLYDTKRDAVRHQHGREDEHVFVNIPPPGMNLCEAESWLHTHRLLAEAGWRLADPDRPDGGLTPIHQIEAATRRRMISILNGRTGA